MRDVADAIANHRIFEFKGDNLIAVAERKGIHIAERRPRRHIDRQLTRQAIVGVESFGHAAIRGKAL